MIIDAAMTARPFLDGARFGAVGAYEWIEGTATGAVDPALPANAGIDGIALAPRDGAGRVTYRTGFVVLRPVDPARRGRVLFEVNNRGRKLIFPNLCAGAASNAPATMAEIGNAFPLRQGYTMVWCGWDPAAPRAGGGLALEAPVVPVTRRVREAFVPGTRLGPMETFRLAFAAAGREGAALTVRRTRADPPAPVAFAFADARTVRLLPEGTLPAPGSIYTLHYRAADPPLSGLGFAATRDFVAWLRRTEAARFVLGFGISQAGRYLRDHLAQGFNRAEDGTRVFDGIFTHVAGTGRMFLNALFAQPGRTRSHHEDWDFPEVAFPFATAGLMAGDASDPKVIETNTSTEYWLKGASLLHTDPAGERDLPGDERVRSYLLAGTEHAGKAGMPTDPGPCVAPRNPHDPMGAVRALLVALERWVADGVAPPDSRVPRIADETLVPAEALRFPAIPGAPRPPAANPMVTVADWVDPVPEDHGWRPLVPAVDADGNEAAGIRLPEIAAPEATYTGWNRYAAPYPEGEVADRAGCRLPFPATRAERIRSGDPRLSLEERPAPDRDAVRLGLVAAGVLLEGDLAG